MSWKNLLIILSWVLMIGVVAGGFGIIFYAVWTISIRDGLTQAEAFWNGVKAILLCIGATGFFGMCVWAFEVNDRINASFGPGLRKKVQAEDESFWRWIRRITIGV